MNKLKLSKKVNETVKYFHKNPERLCKDVEGCYYSSDSVDHATRGCAVGMWIEDKEFTESMDKISVGGVVNLVEEAKSMDMGHKIPKYIRENVGLFLRLQVLHDSSWGFNSTGITDRGLDKLLSLVKGQGLDEEIVFEGIR